MDNVMKYGEIGTKFYLCLKGVVNVNIPNPKLKCGEFEKIHQEKQKLYNWKKKVMDPQIA